VQPIAQTLQSPVDDRKKPEEHCAHAVPLAAVVHPVLQVHCPFAWQTPFRQLQLEEGLLTMVVKHRPVPEIPWSQDVHPAGHGAQVGPKKPEAHDSQDPPVNPGAQLHVPDEEQTPELAQGGEHAEDSMSRSERDPELVEGSCVTSGTEFHSTTRLLDPAFTATQTFEERASEPADNGVEVFEAGEEGSCAKEAFPEKREWG